MLSSTFGSGVNGCQKSDSTLARVSFGKVCTHKSLKIWLLSNSGGKGVHATTFTAGSKYGQSRLSSLSSNLYVYVSQFSQNFIGGSATIEIIFTLQYNFRIDYQAQQHWQDLFRSN